MHCIEFENCRDSCEEVVLWFLREYLPNEFFFLVVEEKDLTEEGVDGWCIRETQNEFSIQIDKNIIIPSFYTRVLLHELFHMYQYYNELETDEDETLEQEHILLNKFYRNH
jgi:hypothetical protein